MQRREQKKNVENTIKYRVKDHFDREKFEIKQFLNKKKFEEFCEKKSEKKKTNLRFKSSRIEL